MRTKRSGGSRSTVALTAMAALALGLGSGGVAAANGGDRGHGVSDDDAQDVYIETVSAPPTNPIPPRCGAGVPARCVVTFSNTDRLQGDVVGTAHNAGAVITSPATATAPPTFISWTSTSLVELSEGPCGSGSYVLQTMMTNAEVHVQADGTSVLSGKVTSRIVPGSGTGDYEGVRGWVFDRGTKPRAASGEQVLFATHRIICAS